MKKKETEMWSRRTWFWLDLMLLVFAEVTDQNFVDEDIGERKGSNIGSAKKAKTSGTDSSDHDQVNFNSIPVTKDWTPQLT